MNEQPAAGRWWRFSIRELCLLVLAIAMFLGWARSLSYGLKRSVPSPLLEQRHYEWDAELRASLEEVGESSKPESEFLDSRPASASYFQERNYKFTLQAAKMDAFMETFKDRIRKATIAAGGGVGQKGRLSILPSGDRRFSVFYDSGEANGMLRVFLSSRDEDNVCLQIITYETPKRE